MQQAIQNLGTALSAALEAPPEGRIAARKNVLAAREALQGRLSDADYRYFEFQLWQEGVARFAEIVAAIGFIDQRLSRWDEAIRAFEAADKLVIPLLEGGAGVERAPKRAPDFHASPLSQR